MTTPNQQPVDYRTPADADDDSAADKLVLISPDAADSPRDFGLWAGVLFLLALTIYSPAMRGEFLWDDDRHVSHNANLRSIEGLTNIWTKFGHLQGGTPQYYPLTHTTYWIEYQLFGQGAGARTLSPLVFHVTNILLHAGAAALLWFILRRLRVPGAWLAAAVFAVHPVHAESVAWISERKNMLSAVFMFGSILAYLKFEGVGDRDDRARAGARSPAAAGAPRDFGGTYSLALGLFIAALLSKTVACSMPAVVALLLWWKRGRLGARELLPLVPFFVIGLGMAAVTSIIEHNYVIGEHYKGGDWDLSPVQRILIAGRAIWFYVMKLLVPLELTFTYPRWDVRAGQLWQWVFVLAVIGATVALWAMRRRIGRAPLVAWPIYVGVLVPALGFFDVYPMRYSFVADHFQYHASPALIALIIGGVVTALRGMGRRSDAAPVVGDVPEQSPTPYVASAVVLVMLSALTWLQAFNYADAATLYRDTVDKNPNAWMAHHNLGFELTEIAEAYSKLGDPASAENSKNLLDEAVGHLSRAVKLRPTHDMALLHWGRALLQQGKDQEAMAKFEQALQVNPDSIEAMSNRAYMLQRAGKKDEAIEAYRQALATCEAGPIAQHGKCGEIARFLGEALESVGRTDDAFAAYTRAVSLAPRNVKARYSLGTMMALRVPKASTSEDRRKRQIEAADQYLEVIRQDPQHQDARISLAVLLVEVGNLQRAREELIQATPINPRSPRLMQAAEVFAEVFTQWEASTRPSTTQSTTQSSTQASTQPTTAAATAPAGVAATQPAPAP
ncbi:MAG: tetratricopeptide repeat protein [Planctomycetota bacterium]|nr:tetratricopeptide repeat protein [Planctomycetota bacterium]